MAKIELKNLSKTYNKKIEALHDINFTIEDGQFFVLLGPSGAGKTTTLRCIAGLEKIDNGSILFNDESVTEDQPASRDVCFVFQQYSLYPHYSVYENLAFPLRELTFNFMLPIFFCPCFFYFLEQTFRLQLSFSYGNHACVFFLLYLVDKFSSLGFEILKIYKKKSITTFISY